MINCNLIDTFKSTEYKQNILNNFVFKISIKKELLTAFGAILSFFYLFIELKEKKDNFIFCVDMKSKPTIMSE